MKAAQELINAGFKVVKLKHLSKAPEGDAWNRNFVDSVDSHATGYGFPLKINGRCSIDPDRYSESVTALKDLGFNLEELLNAGVRTVSTRQGSGGRSMFKSDPRLKWIRFASKDTGVVLELRANSDNLQDCVPGVQYLDREGNHCTQSYHNGKTFMDAVPLPAGFFEWWLKMSEDPEYLRQQQVAFFEALWVGNPMLSVSTGTELAFKPPEGVRSRYNAENDVEDILLRNGYTQDERTGRLAPPTATGTAGVRPIPGKDGLWRSDHASDMLFGVFDAWTAFVVLEHESNIESALAAVGGDHRSADVDQFPEAIADNGQVLIDYERVPGKGRYASYIAATIEQVCQCLISDPEFPWFISRDEFLQDTMLHEKASGESMRLRDHHYVEMRRWFDRRRWEPVSTAMIREAVDAAANAHTTNIARSWAESLKWDGGDRFDDMLRAYGVEWTEYYRAVVEYLWTSHAARALHPGYQADAIVVLVSEKQGTGKTQSIVALAPRIGGHDTYMNVHIEELLSAEKAARVLKGCLVANLDEMRGTSKKEDAEKKAAISRMREAYVPKYKETREEFGRQCMLYATTNQLKFLNDSENRRYHMLPTGDVDLEWIRANRDQLWAQGVAMFKAKGQQWKRALELAPEYTADYEMDDAWDVVIAAWIDSTPLETFTTHDVLTHAVNIPVERQGRAEQTRVGHILRRLGCEKRKQANGGIRQWHYKKPEKVGQVGQVGQEW